MPVFDLEDKRLEQLQEVIDGIYSIHPDDVDRVACNFETSITEMFEVISFDKRFATLMDFFDDSIVRPVKFHRMVHPLLRVGDVFLMTIAKSGDTWNVIYMGPPYGEEVFIEENETCIEKEKLH